MCISLYLSIYLSISLSLSLYIYIYIYMYMYIHIYIYIHTYTHMYYDIILSYMILPSWRGSQTSSSEAAAPSRATRPGSRPLNINYGYYD